MIERPLEFTRLKPTLQAQQSAEGEQELRKISSIGVRSETSLSTTNTATTVEVPEVQRVAPVSFELAAVNLDQKQPGFPQRTLPEYLRSLAVDYHVIERDTYSVVKRVVPEGQTTCALCSRLRRGTLYGFASSMGYNKIALGHHRDDIVETLFLNLFHGGKLQAMPPKLLSDDGQHMVIRPLAMVPETLIEAYANKKRFPIIPCDLCGSQPNLQRAKIKAMLRQWESEYPGRTESIFSAIRDVRPSQLADQKLFDFFGLNKEKPATE